MGTVYLAGPINGCTDFQAKGWRGYVKERIGLSCADPMDRDYRGKEDQNVAQIVEGDKADIDACSVFLVNAVAPSWGTAMEIMYAYERRRYVVAVVGPDTRISPWLRYHAREIFNNWPAAIAHIRGMFQIEGGR